MTSPTQFRPLGSLALFPIIGLAVTGVADLLSVLIGVGQIVSPESALDLDEGGAMSVWLLLQGLIYVLKLPVYIFTVVLFLVWLYRAHSNLEPLQGRNLEFTPGWAVGWWFIPFANLVKPFQVVREVWFESDPDVVDEQSFLMQSARSAPVYMGFWWGMWLTSNILENITSNVYNPESMENIETAGMLFIVSGILSVIAAVLAIMVVRDITTRQGERFARLSTRGMVNDTPPPPPMFGGGQ